MTISYEIRSADLKEVLGYAEKPRNDYDAQRALAPFHPGPVLVRHTRESELEAETARLNWAIANIRTFHRMCDSPKTERSFRDKLDEARDAPKPVVEIVWPKEGG
jgi:hypothetical protein